MSAEVLRRAAALMRERAEKIDDWYSPQAWATASPMSLPIEKADAQHIASWHPAVALAVATWLDSHADIHALRECDERLIAPCPALAVARTYLGES